MKPLLRPIVSTTSQVLEEGDLAHKLHRGASLLNKLCKGLAFKANNLDTLLVTQ